MSDKRKIWKDSLGDLLALFGHRNWIVIADSAYPAQSNSGIETIATGADHIDLLETTLRAIARSKHVRAKVYLDAELGHVTDIDAPGVTKCRQQLEKLLHGRAWSTLAHEQIITKLDEAGKLFRILVLKSTLSVPYTSVFIELDCGYWSQDAETRLRRAVANASAHAK